MNEPPPQFIYNMQETSGIAVAVPTKGGHTAGPPDSFTTTTAHLYNARD